MLVFHLCQLSCCARRGRVSLGATARFFSAAFECVFGRKDLSFCDEHHKRPGSCDGRHSRDGWQLRASQNYNLGDLDFFLFFFFCFLFSSSFFFILRLTSYFKGIFEGVSLGSPDEQRPKPWLASLSPHDARLPYLTLVHFLLGVVAGVRDAWPVSFSCASCSGRTTYICTLDCSSIVECFLLE